METEKSEKTGVGEDVKKRPLIEEARDIAYKNKVPIEHAMMWARMPKGGVAA